MIKRHYRFDFVVENVPCCMTTMWRENDYPKGWYRCKPRFWPQLPELPCNIDPTNVHIFSFGKSI
jgi:hypothetical protein